jgi:dUTPase
MAMFVKFRILYDENGNRGIKPMVMTPDAACADLALPYTISIGAHDRVTVPLLIAFDIPIDWCMYLQPRSSTFTKHGLIGTTGIVDSDYHGTVHAQLYNMDNYNKTFAIGTRLVQVQLFQKQRIQFEPFIGSFTETTRSATIGSTGDV